MIKSMTGFGRGSARFSGGAVTIEIKTVNHKFFEMTAKLPNGISGFEEKVKEAVHKKVKRGKVSLNAVFDGEPAREERVCVNKETAKAYYRELRKLKRALGLKGDIVVDDIILFPGVLNYEVREASLVGMWPSVREALDRAVARLIVDRKREGRAISGDLLRRVKRIGRAVRAIGARAKSNVVEYKKRLAKRIKELSGGQDIDPGRLEMEVAMYAKNCDISEELARLKNHLSNFKKTVLGNGEAGKKLDFIAQELHREANTVGAKASDYKISKSVIDLKTEIEKIREQVKNVE